MCIFSHFLPQVKVSVPIRHTGQMGTFDPSSAILELRSKIYYETYL